ncbi:MAG: thioesterase [Verrucomicrobia bacterium]|nr:MAG: thioesterase [Verrucomicrobiota bacterium]
MTEPQIGASATVDLIVRESDCASALKLSDDPRDNFPAVFATTRMIALMELAGARFLHPLLQPGEMSVGAHIDVSHTAATPIGAKVAATATYRGRDGKLFVFDVVAHDPAGEIGRGTHKRAIVSRDRLIAGAAKRR